ncbi:nucleoside triphosphate pyrophosphohydrolase family protein [Acinetobacter baumannii]
MNLGTNTLDAQFAIMVTALAKDGALIKAELTPADADLLHMGVGVSGEAGELLDAIKKATIYRKELDVENVIEELGDLEFYMERIRQIIGVSRKEILKRNVAKLSKRYSSGKYSNDQAKERADKVVVS